MADSDSPTRKAPLVPLPKDHPIRWPKPEPGQTFADVVSAIPRMEAFYAEVARAQVDAFIEDGIPDCLDREDRIHAASVLEALCAQHASVSDPLELLWILAADAFRPRPGGRPASWSGHDGKGLYELVEAGLSAMGLERDRKKGLRAVIYIIRSKHPEFYGRFSEETLRKGYYAARRASVAKRR
jgi:hypothetical protein